MHGEFPIIPTLHPLADLARRYRETDYGLEAEMTTEEAREIKDGVLWWEVNNKASALYLQGRSYEALGVVKQALKMKRAVPTLVNMSVILESIGRFGEAIGYAKEACEIDAKDDRASALYAEALLRMERYAEGWPLYVKNRASMDWVKHWLPEWTDQGLQGKKVIVIEGGGFGDNIYFFRNLDLLRARGAEVTLICQPSFVSLVEAQGYRAIANWQGNIDIDWRDYDYYTPLLALGAKLGMKWNGPYIKADNFSWEFFRKKRIGLCWRAGEGKSPRKQRSMTDEQVWDVVNSLPKSYKWVNLTKGQPPLKAESVNMETWLDTAKVIANLELVISVDTGVAHLAGAMGKPVWVCLPGLGAWQYPLGHEYHPLYPSMKIFRNSSEGMQEAVDLVVEELEAL